jgi:hypothetical protein
MGHYLGQRLGGSRAAGYDAERSMADGQGRAQPNNYDSPRSLDPGRQGPSAPPASMNVEDEREFNPRGMPREGPPPEYPGGPAGVATLQVPPPQQQLPPQQPQPQPRQAGGHQPQQQLAPQQEPQGPPQPQAQQQPQQQQYQQAPPPGVP